MAFDQHRGDLDGYGIIMEFIHGGGRTPLSTVRLCEMGVIFSMALDMYESPHPAIPYLLMDE